MREQLIKDINNLRKTNKNNWYYLDTTYKNKRVQIKGFGTWLQVFKIGNIDYSNSMDETVKQFNEHLNRYL